MHAFIFFEKNSESKPNMACHPPASRPAPFDGVRSRHGFACASGAFRKKTGTTALRHRARQRSVESSRSVGRGLSVSSRLVSRRVTPDAPVASATARRGAAWSTFVGACTARRNRLGNRSYARTSVIGRRGGPSFPPREEPGGGWGPVSSGDTCAARGPEGGGGVPARAPAASYSDGHQASSKQASAST